ncbi:MAG TPA: response regulator [Burkholderiales bacterium]|nr:response regulator [Burkholderiales bacterium]
MTEVHRNGRQVLVVDDDRDTAMMFATLLKQLGHAAEYVTNPQLVLDIARRLRPWLVFLDIGLPGMSGWELAPLIRQELGHDAVRIVAISGWGNPEHHQRSREAGFDAHVQKPVDLELLRSILAQIK